MRLATLAFIGCFLSLPASAQEPQRQVLELFTSQGCSSCPPADRLAAEMARDDKAFVLTLPVDYWDYLGWKDTLANPANSARQRAYAMARGDRKVFTPQMIVNGREVAVGGDKAAVDGAISRAVQSGGLAVPVKLKVTDGRLEVTVEAGQNRPPAHAEVWAFAIRRSMSVVIARGENAGRTVAYPNVVRHMTRLGAWDGQSVRFEIAADEVLTPEADGVAVLVQSGSGGQPGAILGAAKTDRELSPAQIAVSARPGSY